MGLSYPHYRAAFLGSLSTFFNSLTLLVFFGMEISKRDTIVYAIAYTIWYFLWIRFFFDLKRYRRAMKEFNHENFFQSAVGNLVTGCYVVFSLVLFTVVML